MTQIEAIAYITLHLDPTGFAPLTDAELLALITWSKRTDKYGVAPSEDDWIPTYALNAAIAQGWRIKASRLAGKYDMSEDGLKVNRSQMLEHCLKMAKEYDGQGIDSIPMNTTWQNWGVF